MYLSNYISIYLSIRPTRRSIYQTLNLSIYLSIRDVETSPRGLCRKTGHRCKEGEKQSRACEKIAASVVFVAQRTAVWISTRANWICIIVCFSCVKRMFIQNTFSFDLSRIFFQLSPMFLFSSIHFECFYRPDAQSIMFLFSSIHFQCLYRPDAQSIKCLSEQAAVKSKGRRSEEAAAKSKGCR